MAQTVWTHSNQSAYWQFSGAVPAESAYLSRPANITNGLNYSIRITGEITSDGANGANGYDGNIIIYTVESDGTKTARLTLVMDDLVSGVGDDYQIDQTVQFTATEDSDHIEIYAEITSVDALSDINVYISSLELSVNPLNASSECIGVIRSAKDDVHFLFFYNPVLERNCILRADGESISNVITWSGLNFSNAKDRRINGGGLAGDLLYFTDGSEPKCVHITDYITTPPQYQDEILVIKRGPQLAPVFTKHLLGPANEELSQSLINDFNFQFACHYEYVDKQVSVLSPYSVLCGASVKDEDYRRVRVEFPSLETIPERVESIVFSARVGDTGTFFEIGRIASDSANKYIDFYNTTNGNLLDPFQQLSSSLVPRRSKSMALAKSRLWLGGNLEGYDNAVDVNLTPSISTVGGGELPVYGIYKIKRTNQYWDSVNMVWVPIVSYFELEGSEYFILKTAQDWDSRSGYVSPVDYNPASPFQTVDVINGTEYSMNSLKDTFLNQYTLEYQNDTTVNIVDDIDDLIGKKTFPSSSSYKIGVVFSDSEGRKGGVFTKDEFSVSTPNDKYNQIQILWQINDDLNIPDWAAYYSIVMTKNLKKSWFIEDTCVDISYGRKNSAGDLEESLTYDPKYNYLVVNIQNLVNAGLGYSYVAGDQMIIRDLNGEDREFEIESFDGVDLLLKINSSVGTFNNTLLQYDYEIYRPITSAGAGLLFYETANVYKVDIDPFTSARSYSVKSGFITGDSITVKRNKFSLSGDPLEVTYSAVERLYTSISVENGVWTVGLGRPFIETPIGEVDKLAYIRHSSTYIAGTEVNGLSDFDSGDEGNIPIESGTVRRLQPTDKESTEGDIILALADSDTYSLYVDESRITAGTSSFLVGATKVIGDVRKQRSGYGTIHPESVFEEGGYVYFYDKLSRSYCRYATNGIFPISEYKVVKHFEDQSDLNTESDSVITGYDPFYKIIFVTFTNATTGVKKTIGYSMTRERWISFYNFAPELYFSGSKNMFSVNNGVIYVHNDNINYNRFYGVDQNMKISGSFNDYPDIIKNWKSISIKCSPALWSFVNAEQVVINNGLSLTLTNEDGQLTTINYSEFNGDEGLMYSEIKGDESLGGTVLTGDEIYSNTLQFELSVLFGAYKYITFIKAGFQPSRGHSL